jgi:hypothetical protein
MSIVAACLSSANGDSSFCIEFGNKQNSQKIRDLMYYTASELFQILFNRYVKFALGDIRIEPSIDPKNEIIFYRYDGKKEPNVKIRRPKIILQGNKIIAEMYVQLLTANYDIWPIENFYSDVIELIELIKQVKNIGEFDELVQVYRSKMLSY